MTTDLRRREAPALAEAFERLVRRHRSEIFRAVFRFVRNREDAEDLTQITFLNAYAAMQRGAEPDAPRAWLYAIARNAGSRRFRQSRLVEVELDPETPAPLGEDVPTVHELQAALAQLTLNQRASLLMREVGGLSAKEIGARLEISPGAVATLLFRARRALRAELEGLEPPAEGSRLGGLAVLSAALRPLWLRLIGPVLDGSEVLSRSAAVAGLAAATAGVAVFTTTAVPRPARAGHARAVHAVAPAKPALPSARGRAVLRLQRVSIPTTVHGTNRIASARAPRARDAAAPRPATPSTRISPVGVTPDDAPPKVPAATEQVAPPSPGPAAEPESSPPPQPAREHTEDPPADAQSATEAVVTTATQAVPSTGAVTGALPPAPSPELPPAPVAVPVEVPVEVPTGVPPPVAAPPLPAPPSGILPSG